MNTIGRYSDWGDEDEFALIADLSHWFDRLGAQFRAYKQHVAVCMVLLGTYVCAGMLDVGGKVIAHPFVSLCHFVFVYCLFLLAHGTHVHAMRRDKASWLSLGQIAGEVWYVILPALTVFLSLTYLETWWKYPLALVVWVGSLVAAAFVEFFLEAVVKRLGVTHAQQDRSSAP